MNDMINSIEYYYVIVEDKPGEGCRLINCFRDKGVNLVAFIAFPLEDGKSQLAFFPESAQQLVNTASDEKIALKGPMKAFLIQGEDVLGALVDVHSKLFNANINVHVANGVADGKGGYRYILWVKPESYEDASRVLGV